MTGEDVRDPAQQDTVDEIEGLQPLGEGFPCKYEYVTGSSTICRTQQELKAAMAYDNKLVLVPVAISIGMGLGMLYVASLLGIT